ncbi:TetR family transcriptional regulator [Pararobbsia alpina]|uniref:TetR/AcrR family transcriptional regulator n=1 Tax=Pararobbsia alpina TaxID=621374 RepID=UPI0039A78292
MPAPLASKDEIIDRLFTVFRDHGFEGASLSDLSRATGLGKSSLYHHFPNGKTQMAEAVLERATSVIDSDIAGVTKLGIPLKARLHKVVATLEQMYAGGRTACVLGQLASSNASAEVRQGLRIAFDHWIGAIESLALESGMPAERAHHFSRDWIAWVQGSLVMQAATGETASFQRAMDALVALSGE